MDVSSPVTTPKKSRTKRPTEFISPQETSPLKKIKFLSPKKLFPIFSKPSTSTAALVRKDMGQCNLKFVADEEEQLLQGMAWSTVLKLGSIMKQCFLDFLSDLSEEFRDAGNGILQERPREGEFKAMVLASGFSQ